MRREPRFEAVLFDLDGVLVDSLPHHVEAYAATLAPFGVKVGWRDVCLREGKRSREIVELLSRAAGVELSASELDRLADEKQRRFMDMGPAPLYPGVPELVREVRTSGFKVALVTGTHRANVPFRLGDLAKEFAVVVAGEDVARTKPHPEPYLTAAHHLGVDAARALVVENAPLGIRAGRAAGAFVAAVTSTLPPEDLAEANVIIPNIGRVREVLSS